MKFKNLLNDFFRYQKKYFHKVQDQRLLHSINRDFSHLHTEVHEEAQPIFVLSTGRCGTLLLTELFNRIKGVNPHHSPKPELSYHSSQAYKFPFNDMSLSVAVDTARYEHIRDDYLLNRRFVETNNRISFFAYYLAELYPKALFLHLVRQPEDFVKSGMTRGWYSNSIYDDGRIRPNDPDFNNWNQAMKIAWLWASTNEFINNFREAEPNRTYLIKSEDLFSNAGIIQRAFQFLKIDHVDKQIVRRVIAQKQNVGSKNKKLDIDFSEINKMKLYRAVKDKLLY